MAWDPPLHEGYRLHENHNDGTLRFLKTGSTQGPWRLVPKEEIDALVDRERRRQDFYNDFLGCWRGRIVVIMGTGPMMDRIDGSLAKYLGEREDIIIVGINAMPKVCKHMWGVDPNEVFDIIVGADAVHENIWTEWGWDYADNVRKFCKRRAYAYHHIPVKSAPAPVLSAHRLFYRDSVTAGINLAILGLATATREKVAAGPWMSWPERRLEAANGGRVVLVGVEANRFDHCYSDREDFVLSDVPDIPWPPIDGKLDAHRQLKAMAIDMGTTIYQSAPWSRIDMHEPCDFEEVLQVPEKLRCGVTALGIPAPRERIIPCDVAGVYQGDMADWIGNGRQGPEPVRPTAEVA